MKFKKKYLISLLVLITLISIGLVITKSLLHSKIEEKLKTFDLKGYSLKYNTVEINGFNTIHFSDLIIVSPINDTIFKTQDFRVKVSLRKLLTKQIDIRNIYLSNSSLNLMKDSLSCNYCMLLSDKDVNNDSVPGSETNDINFSAQANRLANTLFNLIPNNLEIENFRISYLYYNDTINATIDHTEIRDNKFNLNCDIRENSLHQIINITGELDKAGKKIHGKITNNETTGNPFTIPFARMKYSALIQMNSLDFKIYFPETTNSVVKLDADFICNDLHLKQSRLADTTIFIPKIRLDLYADIKSNTISIDSSSFIQIDSIKMHTALEISRKNNWKIKLMVDEKMIPAQQFIDALPEGLFGPVKTVRLTGSFDYHFLAELDFGNPDSLTLESDITKHNFKVLDPGELDKMNSSFLYTAYEDGKAVASYIIGPENQQYLTMEQVSPILINAILQSEDGQFFYHNGFRIDAIKEALAHDIKVRKFARGGSTISMQIVKNVFLTRNKNIARKIEEAMIVWLIESNRITSKQRMFDVYLNIIEWGPGIYGVKNAAEFYFRKSPMDLNLDEAIFMASIIPRPKKYMWSFDLDGNLRESQYNHFRVVRNRLMRNNIISADSTEDYIPEVNIKGYSRNPLIKNLQIIPDSLLTDSINAIN